MTLIHLINLDRQPERLSKFIESNRPTLPIARFPAVDGHTLDVSGLIENRTITPEILKTYTAGHLGTALSHLALWRKAIETSAVITVCEDDAIFNHDFVRKSREVLATLKADWDIILWGWNLDAALMIEVIPGVPGMVFCSPPMSRSYDEDFRRELRPAVPHSLKLYQAFGALCYSISPKGAAVLTQFSLPLRPMSILIPRVTGNNEPPQIIQNEGIDIVMSAAYPKIQAFASMPPLAISKNIKEGSAGDEKVIAERAP
jgi:GR25 family glycosyltransferase involved in LPS biosynthesis